MDEEILETAKSICACGAEDEALLKRLCAASAQALERELREGVAPEDCEGAFICASAWLAAAALTDARLGGAEELSSLRAGDVTIEVRGGANSERAAALRRSARQLMVSAPAQTIRPGKNSQLHIKLLIQEEIVLSINIKIN